MRSRQPEYNPRHLEEAVVSGGGPTTAQTRAELDMRIEARRKLLAELGEPFSPQPPTESVIRKSRLKRALRK